MNVLEIKNICKTYIAGNKKANNNITLNLRKGEILCIAGENGAGKTTLMKILCGLVKQDSGSIVKNGNIGMVHQHFMLFSDFTAAENIVYGAEPLLAGIFFDKKKAVCISQQIINENNFTINANSKVKDLTLGEMQKVEICRILYNDAGIIIMDEPTSILSEAECKSLFNTLKKLAANGKSIILITHKLHEIKQIGDRVAVLRKGELTGIHDVDKIDINYIASMMIGNNITSEISSNRKTEPCDNKNPVITFDNVTVIRKKQKKPLLDNVSFSVNSGEILGFAGVGGNGLGVIEAVLGGYLHPVSGKIKHNDKDITGLNNKELRKQGLAYVPADRINVGSALNATIEENMIINNRNWIGKNSEKIKCLTKKHINNFNIETPDIKEKASTLSGGNLQKLILARETECISDYIVFSEPTWGLDFSSCLYVHERIEELRINNTAIILISTDLDEIIKLSNRIIVMYKGKIAGIYLNDKDESIKEKIGKNMQGIFNKD